MRLSPYALALSITLLVGSSFAAPPADSVEFFEQRIRPVLVEHCYECHSGDADEIGGSLWLDSAGAMRDGGDSGPSIIPGDAEASVLVSALKYESAEMPPDGKLPDAVVNDFVRWIEAGAKDPRTSNTPQQHHDATLDIEAGRSFWAFQPIRDVRTRWPEAARRENPIDVMIRDRLAEEGVRPNSAANPETLLRRLSFDLTGMPPDEHLQRAWLADPTAEHWERIVDDLIDSRAFAQHWARHWMDVARYADSNGSDFNATFHDAWRYRDYLVDAFDADTSIDTMIRQQVAGDLLAATCDGERYDNLVATTFLMLGPKMLSERDKPKLTMDVVDEQIDTIGRAFLGMTLGCARCHDHKFDPIATEDYYALAGIFKSTQTLNGESQKYVSTWNKTKLPVSEDRVEAIKRHDQELKSLDKQIKQATEHLATVKRSGERGIVVDDADATLVGKWVKSTLSKHYVGAGYIHDNNGGKGKSSAEFRVRLPKTNEYEVRIAFSTGSNRARNVPVDVASASGVETIELDQRNALPQPPWLSLGKFTFSADQDAVITVRNEGTEGYVIADAVQFLSANDEKPLVSKEQVAQQIAAAQAELDSLKERQSTLKKNPPAPLPMAMAVRDRGDKIGDSPVHIRGEVRNLGDPVKRGFIRVCTPGDASIVDPQGSGRLELASWLTDPDHPLVARVMVNRIWAHVFGQGLVRTVDNFGVRGQRPSHPELLDVLAIDFMREGWRLKPAVRRMVLSQAYARASDFQTDAIAKDPENRLIWRAHRKRLTAEPIRDAMLLATGTLTDDEPVAPVADKGVLATQNNGDSKSAVSGIRSPVRTMYLPIIRGNVSPVLTALDAADPDLLVGKRTTTNVPGQALVLLNSAEINQWTNLTADRVIADATTFEERIELTYRRCLSRSPSPREWQIARALFEQAGDDGHASRDRIRDLVAAIFASAEFRLLD